MRAHAVQKWEEGRRAGEGCVEPAIFLENTQHESDIIEVDENAYVAVAICRLDRRASLRHRESQASVQLPNYKPWYWHQFLPRQMGPRVERRI